MPSNDPTFHTAQVTGRIAPGSVGEVMVTVRGGVEAFLARAHDPAAVFEKGETVTIVEYFPPRTVVVSHERTNA